MNSRNCPYSYRNNQSFPYNHPHPGNNYPFSPHQHQAAPQPTNHETANRRINQANQDHIKKPAPKPQEQPKETKEKTVPKTIDPITEAENNPNSAHYYKKVGNLYYAKQLYPQALENYTRAIEKDDTESVFFSNRARCYKQLGEFNKAYEDVKVAIELDDKNIKAYLLCGQILAEIGKIEPGLEKLRLGLNRIQKGDWAFIIYLTRKALAMSNKQGKKEFIEDIQKNIAKVQKVISLKEEDMKRQKKIDTLSYVKFVVISEKQLINKDYSLHDGQEKMKKYEEIVSLSGNPLKPVIKEAPDTLCCKITMDFMQDPVIAPSGITYEREILKTHLNKGQAFDPVTREPLSLNQVYPNKAVKQAIADYIKKLYCFFPFVLK